MFFLKRIAYIILLIFNCCYNGIICNNVSSAKFVNRPLKILIFETFFPPKTSTAVLNQITGLLDRGHEVYIYAKKPGDMQRVHSDVEKYNLMKRVYFSKKANKDNTHKVSTVGQYRLSSYLYNRRRHVKRYLRNLPSDLHTFDIIYCPFGYRGVEFLNVMKSSRIKAKFVTGFRGADLSRDIKNDLHKYDALFKECDLFLPVCDYFKRKLMWLGCPENKIVVVHSAIDCKKFSFKVRTFNDVIRIISVARLTEKKGLEYAIKAIKNLLKKFPNIEYKIVGTGPLEKKLEELVIKLNIQKNVKLLGWASQDRVAALLDESHLFLLPAVTAKNGDEEGIPNSVKEAMAMGVIPISTYHAGVPELVKDGAGFLVLSKDVPALTEKIKYLIKHPEVWQTMSLAGRKIIEKEYEKEYINDQLEHVFQNLVQQN